MSSKYPLLLFCFVTLASIDNPSKVQAQLIPDNTLGQENSIVTPQQLRDLIEGGATRGSNLFHSFSEFNINQGQQVYFANPQSILNIFTRITGANPSDIFGTLGVDGAANLILINPNGIHFGENATLDISGSFFATTAESVIFSNGFEFSATNPQAPPLLQVNLTPGVQLGSNPQGEITNLGDLGVGLGQNLTLHGTQVTSEGNLTATGGTVQVLGDVISLLGNAQIDVSSPTGGGIVRIGGNFQGQGRIPTAQRTYIDTGVNINADALTTGNGGTVIVWAEETTGFYGNISSRGGAISGNGGFVEVSGKQHLIFRGDVDTSAVNGVAGTLLLDPVNITIANGTGDETGDGTDTFAGNNSATAGSILSAPLSSFDDSAPVTIYESELEGLSGDTNIILQATNDITLQDLADDSLSLAAGSGLIALSADADGDGMGSFVMEDADDTIFTNGRDIAISGASLILGSIDTSTTPTIIAGELIAVVDVDAGGAIPETETSGISIFTFTAPDIGEEISNLDVRFSAAHTFNSDLEVSLQSPAGTVFELFSRIGGSGDNFQDTLLDDTAANSLEDGEAPFDGSFSPTQEGGLAVFNGENSAGVWTLTVNDTFLFADDGTLFRSGDAAPWGTAIGTQLLFNSPVTVTGGNGGDGGAISLSATNGSISGSSLDTSALQGAGGAVTVDAIGNITINGAINTSGDFGDSGAITLNAINGDISAFSLNASGDNSSGGAVSLDATGNITINDAINTAGDFGDGGAISLNAINGDISAVSLNASGLEGAGGAVSLDAIGNITINGAINTAGDFGDGGAITLNTDGNIVATSIDASSRGESIANGGAITLNAGGDIATTDINSSADADLSVSGFVIDDLVVSAVGGEISLNAEGDIATGNLDSSADADVIANASAEIEGDVIAGDGGIIGNLNSEAHGGEINLSAQGNIATTEIDTSAFADADADADAQIEGDLVTGDGGSIGDVNSAAQGGEINLITSQGNISTTEINSSANANTNANANTSAYSFAFADAQIEGDVIAGDGGIIGSLNSQAHGGEINLSSQGNISTTEINALADGDTFASASASASFERGGDVIAGNGGSVSDLQVTSHGGEINLTSQGSISTTEINALADADTFASASASASASTSADASAQIEGDVIAGDGGIIGDLHFTAQGGEINLSAQGNISTTEINSSADTFASASASASASTSAFTDASVEIAGNVIAGNGGSVSDLQVTSQGGEINLTSQGNISTTEIDVSALAFAVAFANAFASTSANTSDDASAQIAGDVIAGDGGSISDLQNAAQGGAINLTAQENLFTSSIKTDAFADTFASASTSANVNAFDDTQIAGEIIAGDGGSISDLQNTAQGGAINLTAQGNISTSSIDTDANVDVNANADTSANATTFADASVEIEGDLVAGDGGSVSNLQNTVQGGAINLTAQGNISTSSINSSTNTEMSGNIDAGVDFNVDAFTQIAGDVINGNIGQASNIAILEQGGNIEIIAETGNFSLSNNSLMTNVAFGDGDAGNIQISASSVNLTNTQIDTTIIGQGNVGNITITALDEINIENSRLDASLVLEADNLGERSNVTLSANSINLTNFSLINTTTFGAGDASDVSLNATEAISLADSSIFSLTAGGGSAGNINLNSGGIISLTGSSAISTAVAFGSTGEGGDITLQAGEQVELLGTGTFLVNETEIVDSDLVLNEIEPNNITSVFIFPEEGSDLILEFDQTQSIENFFSLDAPGNENPNLEFSSQIPFVTVLGTINTSDTNDGYSFEVERVGTQVTFDIDKAETQDNFDLQLRLFNSQGEELASNEDAPTTFGAGGSSNSQDPFLSYIFNQPGTYFLEVKVEFEVENTNPFTPPAENYTLNVSRLDDFFPNSGISVQTRGVEAGGNITIDTPQLILNNGTQISASTEGSGGAGNIFINTNSVSLDNSLISSAVEEDAQVSLGNDVSLININTNNLNLTNNAQISSSSQGMGNAGNVSVIADNQFLLDNSSLSSAVTQTADGNGGSIQVNSPVLSLTNQASISALSSGAGNAGSINLEANQLTLQDSSQAIVSNTANGSAGNLEIAAQTVSLDNQASISAETVSGGGSSIALENLDTLTVTGNSEISASTQQGVGGSLTIEAIQSILLSENSDLLSAANDGGSAGSLEITTGELNVTSDSQISVSSLQGQAGNLVISADNLTLDNGSLTAVTGGGSDGANINLEVDNLLFLVNESEIFANALNAANGGNITIDAKFILAPPPQGSFGSDISANAQLGNGGLVTITTDGLFGIAFQPFNTSFNDITASSEAGVAGIVEILQPNVDPAQSLTALPIELIDAANLVVRSCEGGEDELGQFVVTGRGGLPENPGELLRSNNILVDLVILGTDTVSGWRKEPLTPAETDKERWRWGDRETIVETQGWMMSHNGNIVLTAQVDSSNEKISRLTTAHCSGF